MLMSEFKTCSSCEFENFDPNSEPCNTCDDEFINWKPKEQKNEYKLCPLRWYGCVREKCAWWNAVVNKCAVLSFCDF